MLGGYTRDEYVAASEPELDSAENVVNVLVFVDLHGLDAESLEIVDPEPVSDLVERERFFAPGRDLAAPDGVVFRAVVLEASRMLADR